MKSRLYTRTGDDGTTSLVGGARARKDCARLEAYGTVDELNSWLGLLVASDVLLPERRELLMSIQNRLFDIGAILATEPESEWQPSPLPDAAIGQLEDAIDIIDGGLPRLREFILPGGHPDACRANIARTVARRAERHIVSLARETAAASGDAGQGLPYAAVLRYVNRLSDLLFALAREINVSTHHAEPTWQKG